MNNLPTFKLEEYLGHYEFKAPALLCCSDGETIEMHELLKLASPTERKLWEELTLGYTPVAGHPLLRTTIAQELYPTLTAENILCFAGAEEGIFCALSALCEPADHVILVTPCYQSLLEIPRTKGCNITTLVLEEKNAWRLDLEHLAQAITPQTKAVIINFPHNPTGQILTTHEQKQLIDLLRPQGIWLFADEVYLGLENPTAACAPAPALSYERALSLGVMSKSFGMAGLRIGWIASQDIHVLKKIEAVKHYTSICNSAPAEILAIIALRNKEKILTTTNAITAFNQQLLDAFFIRHAELFSWVAPRGGCTGFVRYHGPESIDQFCTNAREEAGILLLPGTIYDVSSPHFRIGFGRKNMPEVLQKFEEWIAERKSRRSSND